MATRRHRRKENRRKARMAKEMGEVKGFQEGGSVQEGGSAGWGSGWWQNQNPQPPSPGDLFAQDVANLTPEQLNDLRLINDVANALGVSPEDATYFIQNSTPTQIRNLLAGGGGGGGSGGGGGGGGGGAYDAGYFSLAQQAQALDQQIADTQAYQGALALQLEAELGRGDLALSQRTQAEIERLNREQVRLEEKRMAIQRELDIMSLSQGTRGQDIQQRQQDLDAYFATIQLQLQQDDALRQWALDSGQFELATAIEERMRLTQEQASQLTQRGQDIDIRGQDIQAQIAFNDQQLREAESLRAFAISTGDQRLQADAENRLRAAQQQDVALQQYAAQLDAAGLGITAGQGAAQNLANLASSFGSQQTQRDMELARLAANPRDFPQLQIALGGGQSFIDQLLSGQAPTGQSAANVGSTATLGPAWDALVNSITARPDLALYEEAINAANMLGGMGQDIAAAPDLRFLLGLGDLSPVSAPDLSHYARPTGISLPTAAAPGGVIRRPDYSPLPQLGPGVPARDIVGPNIPREARPGLESQLTPLEQQTLRDFQAAAPDVPLDVAVNIARNPGGFRNLAGNPPPAPQAAPQAASYRENQVNAALNNPNWTPTAAQQQTLEQFAAGTLPMMQPGYASQMIHGNPADQFGGIVNPTQEQAADLRLIKTYADKRGLTPQEVISSGVSADEMHRVAGFAGGGTAMLTDEPMMLMGKNSGRVRGVMGENMVRGGSGVPEAVTMGGDRMEVTPFQGGGEMARRTLPGLPARSAQAGAPVRQPGRTIQPLPVRPPGLPARSAQAGQDLNLPPRPQAQAPLPSLFARMDKMLEGSTMTPLTGPSIGGPRPMPGPAPWVPPGRLPQPNPEDLWRVPPWVPPGSLPQPNLEDLRRAAPPRRTVPGFPAPGPQPVQPQMPPGGQAPGMPMPQLPQITPAKIYPDVAPNGMQKPPGFDNYMNPDFRAQARYTQDAIAAFNSYMQAIGIGPNGPIGGPVQTPQPSPWTPPFSFPTGPTPVQPQAPSAFSPGQIIQKLLGSFTPRSFYGLLPSQGEYLGGLSSALGVPAEDFFTSITRSFPKAADPSLMLSGRF